MALRPASPLSIHKTTRVGTVAYQVSKWLCRGALKMPRVCSRRPFETQILSVYWRTSTRHHPWIDRCVQEVLIAGRLLYGTAFPMSEAAQKDDFVIPFGKAKIERPGKDLTIVTLSRCVGQSLTAAEQLKKDFGVEAEVINLRSIKPLDVEAIMKSVKKTGHLMAVESGFPSFGVGAEILALTMEYKHHAAMMKTC